jgi:hypothetical protein
LDQWRQQWAAKRLFIRADGEANKAWGNETIRVHPDQGWLELRLPTPLASLANRPHGRYRLSCPVQFTHRRNQWAAQAASGAVRYDIAYDPGRGRWYLDASWTITSTMAPTVAAVTAGGVVAVDLNAGYLAVWVVDPHGNPVEGPHTITIEMAGLSSSTRDGRRQAAITALVDLARRHRCRAIVEDLNFTDARDTGRETSAAENEGSSSVGPSPGFQQANSVTAWCRWPTTVALRWWLWIRPRPRGRAVNTGKPHCNASIQRQWCHGITRRAW